MSLVDGQVLDGKYVITRRLAEGGTSTVFLGVNERIGREVAVKVLHPAVARDEDVVQRFEREARIVSRIRSPYVADVYDFGTLEDGARFMVMEYLEGESLATQIEREHTIAARPLAAMALQILEGLSAAHAAGVVHRDLKPENVIVTKRGREPLVKIVDFGISKVAPGATPFTGTRDSIFAEAKATAAGAVLGTPLYMSPEQARGSTHLIDQRTDLYSLGVILYEALAGEPPLMGDNVNDLLFRVALDEPVPLTTRAPNVDPGFAAIVTRALAKDVTERWQSADDMHDAITEWKMQFASGSQSVVPCAVPASQVRSTPPALTPMVLVAPPPRSARDSEVARTGVFARARRYAVAVPAAAMILLLIPAARHVFRGDESAPHELMTAAAMIAPEPPLALADPLAAPFAVPSPAPTLAPIAVSALTAAPKHTRWVAPKVHRAPRVIAGSGADVLADPIATVTPSPLAPADAPADELTQRSEPKPSQD